MTDREMAAHNGEWFFSDSVAQRMSEDGWVPLGIGGGASVSWEVDLVTGKGQTVYRTYDENGEVATEEREDDET